MIFERPEGFDQLSPDEQWQHLRTAIPWSDMLSKAINATARYAVIAFLSALLGYHSAKNTYSVRLVPSSTQAQAPKDELQ